MFGRLPSFVRVKYGDDLPLPPPRHRLLTWPVGSCQGTRSRLDAVPLAIVTFEALGPTVYWQGGEASLARSPCPALSGRPLGDRHGLVGAVNLWSCAPPLAHLADAAAR
jgi:hypothetical protein